MGSTLVLRSGTARVVGAVTMGIGVLGVLSLLVGSRVETLPTYGVALAALGLMGWTAFWTPYVEISDGGVVLRNVLRTITLPWPSIQEVEGRYGLRLRTAYGQFTSWAATAPVGRERAAGMDSEAAGEVRRRRDGLADYLVDARLERDRPAVRWHWPELSVAGALLLVALVRIVG